MQLSFHAAQAYAAFQGGDIEAAAHWASAALQSDPDGIGTLLIFGMVMHARGNFQEAASAFGKLTRSQPSEPAHWMNLATSQRAARELDLAAESYATAARLGGWTAVLRYNVALLEFERGNFTLARDCLAHAASFRPVDAEIACRYAHSLMQSGEPAALREALRNWQEWEGWTPDLLAEVATMLMIAGDQPSALGIMEQLCLNVANPLSVELTLIAMLERNNRMEEALQRLSVLGQPDPLLSPDLRARWIGLQAQMETRTGQELKAIEHYRELLQGNVPIEAQQEILFPLAKVLDAAGQKEAAFEAVVAAHRSQIAHFDLTAPLTDPEATGLTAFASALCDPGDVAGWDERDVPTTQESPIFIVAFPRSGTTLLEQALDAHPDLQSMDEQRFLLDAQEFLQRSGVEYPRKLAALSVNELAATRQHYWQQVASKIRLEPGQRLLDKNPLNMLRLPVIRRLWPNAPILLIVRHPFDVVVSNFFQHYRAPDFARLCQDLPTLVSGYAEMFDLWYRQVDVLKPRVLEVRYESLVSEFEAQTRAIAEFCDLQWHDAMLEPSRHAKSKGYIATPSYHQVVQPVNSKAVDRWRSYEDHLRPLNGKVVHLMERWGYSS